MRKMAYFLQLNPPPYEGDLPPIFPSSVGPIEVFDWHFNSLSDLVASFEYNFLVMDKTVELCFIGLVAYFEAFCKDQIASIINICPSLLLQLKKSGRDVLIDVAHLVLFEGDLELALGPMLSEKYDFGTAKQVNSHYQALLKITPFSKDEAEKYDQILNDRNLLIHHGGTYTIKYAEQNLNLRGKPIKHQAYRDSLELTEDDYFDASFLVVKIATKIANISQKALTAFVSKNKIKLTEDQNDALQMLSYPCEILVVTIGPPEKRKKRNSKKSKESR